jgi:hypothetical protein
MRGDERRGEEVRGDETEERRRGSFVFICFFYSFSFQVEIRGNPSLSTEHLYHGTTGKHFWHSLGDRNFSMGYIRIKQHGTNKEMKQISYLGNEIFN